MGYNGFMTLYINTTQHNFMEIGLKQGSKFLGLKKIKTERTQAEKLLPSIEKLVKANNFKLADIKKIEVANQGGSFTSLRIGVITANALAYALGVPINNKRQFSVVKPVYDRELEITKKKERVCG